jgi:hypothetical protein
MLWTKPWRIGGIAGIIFVILFIISIVVGSEPPSWDDSIEDIREYFGEDGDAYLLSDFFTGLAFAVFFLVFIAHLRSLLGLAEGAPATWSRLAFSAGLITLTLGAAAGFFWGGLAFAGSEEVIQQLDDGDVRMLMLLDVYAFSAIGFGLAVFTFASSVVILQTRALWRWIGWLGLVIAVLSVISPLWVLDGEEDSFLGVVSFLPFIGAIIWTLATSINMLLLKTPPEQVAATVPVVER